MRVAEIMKAGPRVIAPDDPLDVAESVLRAIHARQWPVVQQQALVGIVTLRDLTVAHQDNMRRRRVEYLRVGDYMSRAPVVAHPDDDLVQAAMHLTQQQLSSLPIVDGEELVGVITRNDLMAYALRYLEDRERASFPTPVARLMTRTPLAVTDALDGIEDAYAVMRQYNVRHLPVMHDGKLVGIVSDRDLLEAGWLRPEGRSDLLVGEAMTWEVETTSPSSEAVAVGHMLLSDAIGALPVLRKGQLVGIVSKGDYLRYFVSLETCDVARDACDVGREEEVTWTKWTS